MGEFWGRTGAFAGKELRELLRDRRAVFIAFVLPVLVYPVIFSFMTRLERDQARETEEATFRVAVSGEAQALRNRIAEAEGLILTGDANDSTNVRRVRDGLVDLWIDVESRGSVDSAGVVLAPALTLHFHGPNEDSPAALDRVRDLLDSVRAEERQHRFAAAGGAGTLDDFVAWAEEDVATEEETGGAQAGKLVPYLLIFTLFMGAAPLAIDMVAGEKERGTLETLYLTPVDRGQIARAKFLVVAAGTMVTGILNLASLVMCYRLGLIGDVAEGLVLSGGGIARAFILVLPLAWMIGGLLLGISAFARSQKEAQYYVMPAMLMAFVPGVLSMTQDVKLDGFIALLPLANVSIALRDALLGGLPAGKLVLVSAASLFWAGVVLRWTRGVLSREDTILGFDPEPAFGPTPGGRRRAAILGLAATVLIYFYAGQWLQTWKLIPGLALSLWVLLPLTGAAALRFAWAGGRLAPLLSLRRPRPGALLAGALLGLGCFVPMSEGVMPLQSFVLPIPESVSESFGDLEELP
ncbi:MAG: ABC transporter permease, partial [Gemmatimonadetes bacterium]|nr:ABC transporter permease [Gemmatimonadota bacterium]